jgi:hypothetical protein
MNFLKNNHFSFFIVTIIFFGLSASTWSMYNEPEEYKIPSKILNNGILWENDVYKQQGPTCAAHAVSECLKYVHGRNNILPYYLHKYTQYHYGIYNKNGEPAYKNYETGNNIVNLMRFSKEYGVPEIPIGETFQANTGLTFPKGTTKYSFKDIYNVYGHETGDSKLDKIKSALRNYKLPIAIDVMSSKKDDKLLFKRNSHLIPDRLLEIESLRLENQSSESKDKIYHAIVAYGYSDRERGLLIKNSWGIDWYEGTQGKALLNYDYLNTYLQETAYIGWGLKCIEADYSGSFGSGT